MVRAEGRLANEAWEALMTAHASVLKHLKATDVWDEVSMREYDVLYTLSKCHGAMRPHELHRHLLLSQPALSRMVDRLVARGLLDRCGDPADGRGVLLSLTGEGRAIQRRIGTRHAADVARTVSAALTREEMADLASLSRRLTDAASAPTPKSSRSTTR